MMCECRNYRSPALPWYRGPPFSKPIHIPASQELKSEGRDLHLQIREQEWREINHFSCCCFHGKQVAEQTLAPSSLIFSLAFILLSHPHTSNHGSTQGVLVVIKKINTPPQLGFQVRLCRKAIGICLKLWRLTWKEISNWGKWEYCQDDHSIAMCVGRDN